VPVIFFLSDDDCSSPELDADARRICTSISPVFPPIVIDRGLNRLCWNAPAASCLIFHVDHNRMQLQGWWHYSRCILSAFCMEINPAIRNSATSSHCLGMVALMWRTINIGGHRRPYGPISTERKLLTRPNSLRTSARSYVQIALTYPAIYITIACKSRIRKSSRK